MDHNPLHNHTNVDMLRRFYLAKSILHSFLANSISFFLRCVPSVRFVLYVDSDQRWYLRFPSDDGIQFLHLLRFATKELLLLSHAYLVPYI